MSDEQNELEQLRRELEGSNATLRAITPVLLKGRGCWTHEEIVSTVNQWFHERNELERLRRQNAVIISALEQTRDAGARYLSPEQVRPLVDAIRTIFHGNYDNAHDCMAASKVAREALDHAKQLGL